MVRLTLSPAMWRTKSNGGKIVVVMLILPFCAAVFLSRLQAVMPDNSVNVINIKITLFNATSLKMNWDFSSVFLASCKKVCTYNQTKHR